MLAGGNDEILLHRYLLRTNLFINFAVFIYVELL